MVGDLTRDDLERLREEIRRHDRLYYVVAQPEISDLEYDRLMQRLQDFEAAHPEWITPDSPTQRVGDQPVDGLRQVAHRVPMLSIDNTYDEEALRQYFERVEKLLAGQAIRWVVEWKVDGVAASLRYEEGRLVQAVTRGNGEVGDDVTHTIRTATGVPLHLLGDSIPPVLEVRGEVYMTNSDLVELNQKRTDRGEAPFKNTRNVTAGTIRLLEPREAAERRLRFLCHGVGECEGVDLEDHHSFLQMVTRLGIPVTPGVACLESTQQAMAHCRQLLDQIQDLDFEVDGLVIKVDSFQQRKALGSTAKAPRWVIALKMEKYEATTRVAAIRVQVGKTGTITPVAELEPVQLAGTTVSRCSLHNAEEIARKDIRVGDVVVVEKAGKIIPHIVRVEKHLRSEALSAFEFPTRCPECQAPLARDLRGVYIRCTSSVCPAQWKQRLRFFASRDCMDIEGLGDKLVSQLVDQKLVTDFATLYGLQEKTVADLERMGDKSARQLIDGIGRSRQAGLARVLHALAIRHVGQRVAQVLADRFRTIDALQEASVQQLASTPEIGPIIAQSVYDYLHGDEGIETMRQLREAGVLLEQPKEAVIPGDGPWSGTTWVVTGTLAKYSRDEIHQTIAALGGKAASSVSKSTSYLVAGEKAGSKLDKANQLGVRVLSEEQFEQMLQKATSGEGSATGKA